MTTSAHDAEETREVWELASRKYVHEHEELLAQVPGYHLFDVEDELLGPLLAGGPRVLHPQSGHGLDDVALVRAGAASVLGLDYSRTAVDAAQLRADALGIACRYVTAEIPPFPVADCAVDLVYTGKGALIWLADLDAWSSEVARVLVPGGRLFVHEAHPAAPLWTWDADEVGVRPDRSYFARTHVNDTFPANGAIERQHTLGEIITSVARAGLEVLDLREHPEPFWRPDHLQAAAAWAGRVPNSFTLFARRRP